MNNLDELFKENSKMPNFAKRIIYFIRKLLIIGRINESNIYIIPCKQLKRSLYINKILGRIAKYKSKVIFSTQLLKHEIFIKELAKVTTSSKNDSIISFYLMEKILDYICECSKTNLKTQEIVIAINNLDEIRKNMILNLSCLCKRISIVTNSKIQKFKKIEEELNIKFGMPLLVSNNKKKALAKSNIIINIDLNEAEFNKYNINSEAIVINVNNKIHITKKNFNGVNILDYYIEFDYNRLFKNSILYDNFDRKDVYESILVNENNIQGHLEKDKVRIVNLVGRNGIIQKEEFKSKLNTSI